MKSLLCAGVAACAMTAVASADVTYEFVDFTADGFEFFEIFAAGELTGTLTGVGVDATLVLPGESFTWANDLTILVGTADFSTINLQAGGFSNTGADERFGWANGNSGSAGTTVVDSVSLGTPLDMSALTVFLGNGYGSGGPGVWTGSITLQGVDLVPAPGALALLGMAGLAGRRRRRG